MYQLKCNLLSLSALTQLSFLSPSSVDVPICHLTSGNQAIWSSEGDCRKDIVGALMRAPSDIWTSGDWQKRQRWCLHLLHRQLSPPSPLDECGIVVVAAIAWVINLRGRQPTRVFPIFPMMPSVLPILMFTLISLNLPSRAARAVHLQKKGELYTAPPFQFSLFRNHLVFLQTHCWLIANLGKSSDLGFYQKMLVMSIFCSSRKAPWRPSWLERLHSNSCRGKITVRYPKFDIMVLMLKTACSTNRL